MKALWDFYPRISKAVFRVHKKNKLSHGHDFDHAFAVATLAYRFCEDKEGRSRLAWLAGICHNADRIIAINKNVHRARTSSREIRLLVRQWLDLESSLSLQDKNIVVRAVVNHDKPNFPSDDSVAVALKDADRVVNMRLDALIRFGQFNNDLPPVNPFLLINDRQGKYGKRSSVMADLLDIFDWGNLKDKKFCVRTAKAKELTVKRLILLRKSLTRIIIQRKEDGLIPYPRIFR